MSNITEGCFINCQCGFSGISNPELRGYDLYQSCPKCGNGKFACTLTRPYFESIFQDYIIALGAMTTDEHTNNRTNDGGE